VLKESAGKELIAAVRAIAAGELYVSVSLRKPSLGHPGGGNRGRDAEGRS
jgi:DNA-binding NarL/FixJ family response regulator